MDGDARPAGSGYDIGADEWTGQGTRTPMPTTTTNPAVTSTATATPTRTVTPSPTPIAWRPGETFHAANRSLGGILRVVGDIAIWLVVVVVPVLVVPVVVIIVLVWLSGRRRARTQGAPSQGPAARASTEAGDPGASPPNR